MSKSLNCLIIFLCWTTSLSAGTTVKENIDVRLVKDDYKYSFSNLPSMIESNSELYYTLNYIRPFQTITHFAKYYNRTLFEHTYEIGELGYRSIKSELFSSGANRHLIVAGDSNTFGVGVSDNETLPVLLAHAKPNYHPYNFGIRGGGPHNTLGIMEYFPWEKLITDKKGYFIYNYYDFLLERVIGTKSYMAWSKGNAPEYKLNDRGEAVYNGAFKDGQITKIYQQIIKIKWLDELLPNLPRYHEDHLVLLTAIFLKMQKEYLNKFPEGKFIVALNNAFSELVPGRMERLRKELEKNKVSYIVLPDIAFDAKFRQPDMHLNAEGHQAEAELILKGIQ